MWTLNYIVSLKKNPMVTLKKNIEKKLEQNFFYAAVTFTLIYKNIILIPIYVNNF